MTSGKCWALVKRMAPAAPEVRQSIYKGLKAGRGWGVAGWGRGGEEPRLGLEVGGAMSSLKAWGGVISQVSDRSDLDKPHWALQDGVVLLFMALSPQGYPATDMSGLSVGK